jgi:uncharacterized protein with von Willebrand factor type A (vWA) domain
MIDAASRSSRPFADQLLDFIGELRAAGVPISIAESLDAMRASPIAGLTRVRMREALRASLIKDEAHRDIFERTFLAYFSPLLKFADEARQSRGGALGLHGTRGRTSTQTEAIFSSNIQTATASRASPTPIVPLHDQIRSQRSEYRVKLTSGFNQPDRRSSGISPALGEDQESTATRDSVRTHAGATSGISLPIERVPFASYSALEYQQARQMLAPLLRHLKIRLGRRTRSAHAGRIALRRTLHAAVQRGGLPLDLRFRQRRPKHIELVVLADVSGSVQYASNLLLELIAGVREHFRRVRSFVFINELAEADFEDGHLIMTPNLDLYARSDFGRVLMQLHTEHLGWFNRSTVVVIMGDGRNNRRPARAELLRRITSRCRLTLWLNPEPANRWNTGDSAINAYQAMVDCVLPCDNLRAITKNLDSSVFRSLSRS